MPAVVKIGISAWTEKTLIASGWYPRDARTPEDRLRHYASQFSLAEADAPYYAVPSPAVAQAWVDRTPASFTMNVKAHALLTGHHTDPKRLPRDVREALPAPLREKRRVYAKDVPPELIAEMGRRFREAIEPLRAAGKLGLVLFQYPVWLPAAPDARQKVVAARELLPGVPIAVELRNETWMSPKNRARTLAFLREHGFVYTCVDEPQGFASSVPPVAEATAPVALIRFHGRNAATWNRRTETAAERFDYLYTADELRQWVPNVQRLAGEADEVHVVMNNCHRDYAVRNAADMQALVADSGLGARPGTPASEQVAG